MKIAIINDVECELEKEGLVAGDSDDLSTDKGDSQSLIIASRLNKYLSGIEKFVCSNSKKRLSKLVHNIRVKSKDSYLAKIPVLYLDALLERSFGVLNGSRIDISSDLFNHTRIAAEGGESISVVRKRAIGLIDSICKDNVNTLILSHPFCCQIIINSLFGKSLITLTNFWFKKGSVVILNKSSNKWTLEKAVNLLEDKAYSLDEIYLDLISTRRD